MSARLLADLSNPKAGGDLYLLKRHVKADKMYCIEFAVVGSGKFPTDMLRRDMCHPTDEGEAVSLIGEYDEPRRIVRLKAWSTDKWWRPTYGRWQSFGWSVVTAGPDAQKVWPNG